MRDTFHEAIAAASTARPMQGLIARLRHRALPLFPAALFALAMPMGGAEAQDAAQPAAATPADTAPDSQWSKVCNADPNTKREICLVLQELHAETGQFIASATIRQFTGDPKIAFIAAVPPGMLIQPGIQLQIDNGKPYQIKYGVCLTSACYGELDVDDAFIASLKGGSKFVLTTQNQAAKGVSFPMSLAGFAKIYDGKALDGPGYLKRQEALNKGLQAKSEDFRKKLIEEQQKQAGNAPAPAPAPAN